MEVKGHGAGKRTARRVLGREKLVKMEDMLLDESMDEGEGEEGEDVGLRDEGGEDASDAESRTTAGESHQTFVSALEDEF